MPWVKDERSFRDFLSLVIVHAPDEFPREDYLQPEEQLTLNAAFAELRFGLALLSLPQTGPRARSELESLLAVAYSEYSQGHDIEGAHLLQALEVKAFGPPGDA